MAYMAPMLYLYMQPCCSICTNRTKRSCNGIAALTVEPLRWMRARNGDGPLALGYFAKDEILIFQKLVFDTLTSNRTVHTVALRTGTFDRIKVQATILIAIQLRKYLKVSIPCSAQVWNTCVEQEQMYSCCACTTYSIQRSICAARFVQTYVFWSKKTTPFCV